MKQILKKNFFGKDADFFIGKFVIISEIKELDREGSAIEVTFEATK